MPRQRVYASNAEKQQAFRDRRAQLQQAAQAGYTDAELGRAARDLHNRLAYEASQGNTQAKALVGETPANTLRNISAHFESVGKPNG